VPLSTGDRDPADLRRWSLRSSLTHFRVRSLRCSRPPCISTG
jgi:hypothetical protein